MRLTFLQVLFIHVLIISVITRSLFVVLPAKQVIYNLSCFSWLCLDSLPRKSSVLDVNLTTYTNAHGIRQSILLIYFRAVMNENEKRKGCSKEERKGEWEKDNDIRQSSDYTTRILFFGCFVEHLALLT